jgi:predicted nucleotidyltransferase
LVELVLFGSLARGDFRPTSDEDVLAVLKDLNKGRDRELTGDFQMETAARTFDLISLLLFGDELIRRVILKEGIAI